MEVEGTTGAEEDGVGIEPLMIAEHLDAGRVEADHLQGETATHIKETAIVICLKGVAVAGKISGEDAPPAVQYLHPPAIPLAHDHQVRPTNVLGETV